jgi:hypothetical protein
MRKGFYEQSGYFFSISTAHHEERSDIRVRSKSHRVAKVKRTNVELARGEQALVRRGGSNFQRRRDEIEKSKRQRGKEYKT